MLTLLRRRDVALPITVYELTGSAPGGIIASWVGHDGAAAVDAASFVMGPVR